MPWHVLAHLVLPAVLPAPLNFLVVNLMTFLETQIFYSFTICMNIIKFPIICAYLRVSLRHTKKAVPKEEQTMIHDAIFVCFFLIFKSYVRMLRVST